MPNLTGRRRLKSCECLQQRGLSRAASARDGDQLAWLHRQRQLLQYLPRAGMPAHVDRVDSPAALRFWRDLDGVLRTALWSAA